MTKIETNSRPGSAFENKDRYSKGMFAWTD